MRHGRVAWERLGHGARGGRPTDTVVALRADAPSVLLRALSPVRCAHKGPELGNVVRTQGRNQAVVCGVVLRNSVPCVRNRDLRAKEEHPPAPPDASSREPEPLGPGPTSANTVSDEHPALL